MIWKLIIQWPSYIFQMNINNRSFMQIVPAEFGKFSPIPFRILVKNYWTSRRSVISNINTGPTNAPFPWGWTKSTQPWFEECFLVRSLLSIVALVSIDSSHESLNHSEFVISSRVWNQLWRLCACKRPYAHLVIL